MEKHSVALKMKNVYKSFPRIESNTITHALDNINLELHNDEFICIVGESGCGKSTLLRLIAGLVVPTKGTITINDKPITGPSPNRGMVFQKATLFPWLTVKENIAFSLKLQKKQDPEKVDQILSLIRLEKFKDDYTGQLSGGMAQRVELARSIINEPDILLLDEPLGALDAFTRMDMQDEILNMWNEKQQLALMVTHDIDEAIYMGTKVLVMDPHPGKIQAEIPIELEYPRDRGSDKFLKYRNDILDMLNYKDKQTI